MIGLGFQRYEFVLVSDPMIIPSICLNAYPYIEREVIFNTLVPPRVELGISKSRIGYPSAVDCRLMCTCVSYQWKADSPTCALVKDTREVCSLYTYGLFS